jgi:hypothetical protein
MKEVLSFTMGFITIAANGGVVVSLYTSDCSHHSATDNETWGITNV